MPETYPDFFNDVFGPIMQPFSSSHTAAPCRIAYLANCLLGEELKDVTIVIKPEGSFWKSFKMHYSEIALLSGAAGHLPDNPVQFSIKEYYRERGISWRFVKDEVPETAHHSSAKIMLEGSSGKKAWLVGNSLGGGLVETTCINGYYFRATGDAYMALLFDPEDKLDFGAASKALERKYDCLDKGEVRQDGLGVMYWFNTSSPVSAADVAALSGWKNTAVLKPVAAIVTRSDRGPQLFKSFTEWKELARKTGKGLAETAIEYEMNYSRLSRGEVIAYMRDVVWEKMHRTTHAVLEEGAVPIEDPFTGYHYQEWFEYAKGPLSFVDGAIARSVGYGMAAMAPVPGIEFVPAPMGAGGGLLYSSLRAVREQLGCSDEALLRGLFVAAGVGAVCFTRTEPGGTNIGCAGEQGICSAMAAAAITEMAGGTADQVEWAAARALQVTIGWPCDPVSGARGGPCYARALSCVVNAVLFSQLALSGKDSAFPLDEIIDLADSIGRLGCKERDRCQGGWAHNGLPSAQKAGREFAEWHRAQDEKNEKQAGNA